MRVLFVFGCSLFPSLPIHRLRTITLDAKTFLPQLFPFVGFIPDTLSMQWLLSS